MRCAPPVFVTCDGGPAWAGCQAVLHALASAALAAWLSAWAGWPPVATAGVVFAAAASAGLVAWRRSMAQPVPLAWDGACWGAGVPAVTGQVEVMIDLGHWLLLRFRPDEATAPVRWLAVSAQAAGGALHGLRVALHSSPARSVRLAAGLRSAEHQPG